jgi:hypothetical protein
MKTLYASAIILCLALTSCSIPKSYFTVATREKVESKNISVDQLQFYIDRDVELRRELTSGDVEVTSGKIKFENGKYIHIILLKKFTPGVCTKIEDKKLEISFESGDGKSLGFGVEGKTTPETNYQLFAQEWLTPKNSPQTTIGKITYDNKVYYIQPNGTAARLMIKKSVIDKMKVKKRVMKGRKVK